MVMLGERHLRRAIASYMEHYHLERCHQGIGNRPKEGVPELASGPVERTERLVGILSHYYRRAA
jgi:putative transposase